MSPITFYSSFATYYETIFPFSASVYAFLRHSIPPHCRICLDIGCGTGHYAARLTEHGLTMAAVDLDTEMIAYAQQHYPAAYLGSVPTRYV